MTDVAGAIVINSQQLNAEDLISGPITITITNVVVKSGEQPVAIHYEGDNGKPYFPCKSMCKLLVHAWGADGRAYVGRRLTLFRDPAVKWGGMAVGGIRISHMSDIVGDATLAITVTRGKRAPYTVKPLARAKPTATNPNPGESPAGAGHAEIPSGDEAEGVSVEPSANISDQAAPSPPSGAPDASPPPPASGAGGRVESPPGAAAAPSEHVFIGVTLTQEEIEMESGEAWANAFVDMLGTYSDANAKRLWELNRVHVEAAYATDAFDICALARRVEAAWKQRGLG